MKILIIASASFAPFFLSNSPGDVIDMPEEISNDLIAAGCAQEFVEESEKAPEETTKTSEPSAPKEVAPEETTKTSEPSAPKEVAPEETTKKPTKK